jgi:hypothetical protein
MKSKMTDLLTDVAGYYSDKLAEHGDSPRGVDWNSEESQVLRFTQLTKLIDDPTPSFSINDLGCGCGAMFDYLDSQQLDFSYTGVDVSSDMVNAAELRRNCNTNARFIVSSEPDQVADYGVASGIFNVRLGFADTDWFAHVKVTLDILDRTSRRGFAFNCLTSYSDADMMKDYLYYADPCVLFDLCKRSYSRHIALLHDYGLYEFTVLVRKSL